MPDKGLGREGTSYIQVPITSETNIAHNDEDNSEHKMKVRGWKPVDEDKRWGPKR